MSADRKAVERHHRKPRSRGGTDTSPPNNVVTVVKKYHQAYHLLFGNMQPNEIARVLTDAWIDPDYYLVAVKRKKKSAKRRKRMWCKDCQAEILGHLPEKP